MGRSLGYSWSQVSFELKSILKHIRSEFHYFYTSWHQKLDILCLLSKLLLSGETERERLGRLVAKGLGLIPTSENCLWSRTHHAESATDRAWSRTLTGFTQVRGHPHKTARSNPPWAKCNQRLWCRLKIKTYVTHLQLNPFLCVIVIQTSIWLTKC